MKFKKKIAMAMAVAAICSSIAVPVKAEAAVCDHYYKQAGMTPNVYTQQHGYSVGEDEYKNCVITTVERTYTFTCIFCNDSFTKTEKIITHSDCGL